jgi:hypothetical protein
VISLFPNFCMQVPALVRQMVLPPLPLRPASAIYRFLVLTLFLPVFLMLQLFQWLGLLLDEIFFRRYRNVDIKQPVFILGIPRSGTTYLHRLMARDTQFTTFVTWECLFGLSVSWRRLFLCLARLDRAIGRPAERIIEALDRWAFRRLDSVHPVRLTEPEEDYFCFMPILRCFILILAFPRAGWLWDMGRLDQAISGKERRRIAKWYRACLQRHLYVHGADKTLLSKNAALAGMALTLAEEFPDCRIVDCRRAPSEVIASQFDSLSGGMRAFGVTREHTGFRDRLLEQLAFAYRNLDRLAGHMDQEAYCSVSMTRLARDPGGVVASIYRRFGLKMSRDCRRRLSSLPTQPHRARDLPDLARWGVDNALLNGIFASDDQVREC